MIYIGSSNVYRFVEILNQEVQDKLSIRKCTKIESFRAAMDALRELDGFIIISVIENFLCDAVGDLKVKEEVEKAIGKAMEDFVKVVEETVKRLPKSRFVDINEIITKDLNFLIIFGDTKACETRQTHYISRNN